MEDFYMKRSHSHVPKFGSWDFDGDLPFTQCFKSARNTPGFFRYSFSQDRDLYVTGDLCQNDVITPAVIVVPRRRGKLSYSTKEKEEKLAVYKQKSPPSPVATTPSPPRRQAKAVDEDLYKISPEILLLASSRKKGMWKWSLFSSCMKMKINCVRY